MSFTIMVHLGFRTHDGIPLIKLPYFVQRFEARIQMNTLKRLREFSDLSGLRHTAGDGPEPASRLRNTCRKFSEISQASNLDLKWIYAISFATAGKCWIIELTCPKVRIRFSINLFASISRWAYNGHFCVLLKWLLNQCRHFRWCLFNTKHDSSTHAQHVQEVSSSHFHPWFVAWGRFAAGHPFGEIASRNAPCQS